MGQNSQHGTLPAHTMRLSDSSKVDVLVIGGGLGGLLTAASLARTGSRVLVAEQSRRLGGRFSSYQHRGYAIPTGALHYVPHGPTGVLGQELIRLGLTGLIERGNVFASVYQRGKHVVLRRPIDILRLLGPLEAMQLILLMLRLKSVKQLTEPETFGSCLRRHTKNENILSLWETFSEFALSITIDDIAYEEMRSVIKAVNNFGEPGMVKGGCANIVDHLADCLRIHGGLIFCGTEVRAINLKNGHVVSAELFDRESGQIHHVVVDNIVSNISPLETVKLLPSPHNEDLSNMLNGLPAAKGLKVHFSSNISLIPHTGIMFCVGTRRISGVVQPTNVDPTLAPPGKHLLIGFQIPKSSDLAAERELAIEDLRDIFGSDFDDHCEVLSFTVFQNEKWPVNRAKQGRDFRGSIDVKGLWFVGDAVKPEGYVMVEGVAKSSLNMVSCILQIRNNGAESLYELQHLTNGSIRSYLRRVFRRTTPTA